MIIKQFVYVIWLKIGATYNFQFSGATHPHNTMPKPTALLRQKLTVSKKIKKKDIKNDIFCYDDIVNEI